MTADGKQGESVDAALLERQHQYGSVVSSLQKQSAELVTSGEYVKANDLKHELSNHMPSTDYPTDFEENDIPNETIMVKRIEPDTLPGYEYIVTRWRAPGGKDYNHRVLMVALTEQGTRNDDMGVIDIKLPAESTGKPAEIMSKSYDGDASTSNIPFDPSKQAAFEGLLAPIKGIDAKLSAELATVSAEIHDQKLAMQLQLRNRFRGVTGGPAPEMAVS